MFSPMFASYAEPLPQLPECIVLIGVALPLAAPLAGFVETGVESL